MMRAPIVVQEDTVLVAAHRLDDGLMADVEDACNKAGARVVMWSGGAIPADHRGRPSVVVAGLPWGERRIPEDLVDLTTRAVPGLSIMLLCAEPLLRPTMSLQNGRVTLLGPPLSVPRLCSRLRILMADRRSGAGSFGSFDTAPGVAGARSPVAVRRFQHTNFWLGAISARAAGTRDQSEPTLPPVAFRPSAGLAVILPGPGRVATERDVSDCVQILQGSRSDDAVTSELASRLKRDAGFVHLSPSGETWTVYWPDGRWPLSLVSPLRLPHASDLSRGHRRGTPLFRMRAASGDLMVGLTATPPAEAGVEAPSETEANLRALSVTQGGAALHDALERRLRATPTPFAGLVVEVQ